MLFVVLQYRRADVQTHIRSLEAEPGEHSVVIITFIEISRHLKVTDGFGGTGSRAPNGIPNFPQSGLRPFRTFCDVFVNAPGFDEMRFSLCCSFHKLSPDSGCDPFYPKPPSVESLSSCWFSVLFKGTKENEDDAAAVGSSAGSGDVLSGKKCNQIK